MDPSDPNGTWIRSSHFLETPCLNTEPEIHQHVIINDVPKPEGVGVSRRGRGANVKI